MVKDDKREIEIISKEENYFRMALEKTRDLIFSGEQNLIINRELVKILEKKIKSLNNK